MRKFVECLKIDFMAYVRKTVDEYEVQGNYGQGWEMVTTETERSEARQRLKEYRDNDPHPHRLIKKRVKIESIEPLRPLTAEHVMSMTLTNSDR